MTLFEQLEKDNAAFKELHGSISKRVDKAIAPTMAALASPDIDHDIARKIGENIYKVIPSFNAKRSICEDSHATVGKKIGYMYEANTYGSPDRAAFIHPDRLFWYLTGDHVKLVSRTDKREALRDFYNLCTAIKNKVDDTEKIVEVEIPVTTFEPFLFTYDKNNKDRNSETKKYFGIGKQDTATITSVCVEMPAVGSTNSNSYHTSGMKPSKRRIKDGTNKGNLTIKLKAFAKNTSVGEITIHKNANSFNGDATDAPWSSSAVAKYIVNEWETIIEHPDVQAAINEWLDTQRLITKSFHFLRKKYQKQLFMAEI
jgi:hypothetical protein